MGPQVFHVLTEFRFDVAHAVASSKVLQTEVGKISGAAESALNSLQSIGRGILSSFGLMGGATAFMYGAIQASEKFEESQRKLSNVMLSNQDIFGKTGITFKQAMAQSEKIMDSVVGKAQEFGLDPTELLNQTNMISPMLLSHGLDGADMAKSIDISRGLLKSAPTLGVDPSMLGGQLINMVLGRADGNNTLFQRLSSETKPFKDNNLTNAKAYNALDPAKRIDILTKSLLQFGSNADILKGNMMSLNGQITIFRSLIYGMFSIFRSFGKILAEPIKKIIFEVNKFLAKDGKQIVDIVSGLFKKLLSDPKKLLVNLMQLSKLKTDLSITASIMKFVVGLEAIGWVLRRLGITIGAGVLQAGLRYLWAGLGMLARSFVFIFPYIVKFGMFLMKHVLLPIALMMTIMQGISRGMAQAKITDAGFLVKNSVKLTSFMARMATALGNIFSPVTEAIQGIADMVEWIFTFGTISQWVVDHLDDVASAFEEIGKFVVFLMSVLSGLVSVFMELFNIDWTMIFDPAKLGEMIAKAFNDGFDNYWNTKYDTNGSAIEMPAAQTNVKIDKIEIRNDFKEQMEPDRIAFTMQEQFMKAALNPTSSNFKSLRNPLMGP